MFQFTPLREGRPETKTRKFLFLSFQFTPLREGRPLEDVANMAKMGFNSRPCVRGDLRRCA